MKTGRKDKKTSFVCLFNNEKEVLNMSIKYLYYICRCGKRVIPLSNPSKCPHCGRVTCLR